MAKKVLLILFIVFLLIAIPSILYFVSQQKTSSVVTPATTLTFVPVTQSVNVGDNVSLDISMNPGTNSVSQVKLLISYDPTKLATTDTGFSPNVTSFPSEVGAPIYGDGTVAVTLSIGTNSPPIQTTTKVASITFKALETTDAAPTQITFNTQTQVLSSTGNQNVLSSASPATVTITRASETPTPFPTTSAPLTPTPTITSSANNLAVNTNITGPVCISFTADRPTNGVVPFNVNFTLVATDSAAVISKATFNFGDGTKQDITSANGLGLNPTTVNALTSHIYNAAGTFTATGSITDVNGNVSVTGTCSIAVTVTTGTASATITPILTPVPTQIAQTTPIPSPLPPTGSNSFSIMLVFGVILTVAGAVLILSL